MKCRLTPSVVPAILLSCGALPSFAVYGCSYAIQASANRLAQEQTKEFTLNLNRVQPFLDCLNRPGGTCPADGRTSTEAERYFSPDTPRAKAQPYTPVAWTRPYGADVRLERNEDRATLIAADLARDVLNHDVQKQLDALFAAVLGMRSASIGPQGKELFKMDDDGKEVSLNVSLESFKEYQERIEAATLLGGWDALDRETQLYKGAIGDDEGCRRNYISQYFTAYFRDGKFFQGSIDVSELKRKIVSKLTDLAPGLPSGEYDTLVGSLFPQYKFDQTASTYVFGKVQDTGFVTRGGQSFAVPVIGVSLTLGSSEIKRPQLDYIAVGRDLIRVLLHALYDPRMQLPAVSSATAVTAACPLPVNDPEKTNVNAQEFERIESAATTWEGVISAGVGRIVRGASFLALNNEALATAIETAVGVALRKPIEKVYWCWYACKLNEHFPRVGDYAVTSFGEKMTLRVSVSGIPAESIPIKGKAEHK